MTKKKMIETYLGSKHNGVLSGRGPGVGNGRGGGEGRVVPQEGFGPHGLRALQGQLAGRLGGPP